MNVQVIYLLTSWKRDYNIPDTAFDDLLKIIRQILPDRNVLPPSWHLFKGIIGVGDLDDYQVHVCTCHKHAYPPLSRSKYDEHKDDQCPHANCQAFRFRETSQGKYEPMLVRCVGGPCCAEGRPTFGFLCHAQ